MAALWTRTQQCMMGKERPAATTADVGGGRGSVWGRGLWIRGGTEVRLRANFDRNK